jgi:hypothetical protein
MEVLKSGLFYKMSGQDKIIKKLFMAKTNVINEAWQDDEVSGLLLLPGPPGFHRRATSWTPSVPPRPGGSLAS